MKHIVGFLFLTLSVGFSFGQNGPGSGNCLDFDGTNDYVDIGDVLFDGRSVFTIEAWINPHTIRTKASPSGHNSNEGAIIHKNGASDDNLGLTVSSGGIAFYLDNGSDNTLIGSVPPTNQWTHVAATYDGTTMNLYINGVLDNSMAVAGSGGLVNNTNSLRIGGMHGVGGGNPHHFDGEIDEVRIWSMVRTQGNVRGRMCRKLNGTEGNLLAYYRMDASTGTTLADVLGGNNGTLTNMSNADWIVSGAPIGNLSARSYPGGGWSGATTLTLTSPAGQDALTVSAMTGTPTGVHIYGVTEAPNVTCGATGVGSNDRYFGVFVVNGTAPSYTATYDYSGNPNLNATNEPNLDLYQRSDNSVTACAAWTTLLATLNMPGDFLEETGMTGRNEFILTAETTPLPIELLSFTATATANGKRVDLNWQTTSEINNDYFTVEKSKDGEVWVEVAKQSGAGNSSDILSYQDIDFSPYSGTSFYRLKQTDFDGKYSYSRTAVINRSHTGYSVYPNPTTTELNISGFKGTEYVKVYGSDGRIVYEGTSNSINTKSWVSGLYHVTIEDSASFNIERFTIIR